jgi:hypothetical protein
MIGVDETYSLGPRVCERALVWHLGQLRLRDQAALAAAAHEARLVFPVVVTDPEDPITALPGYGPALQALARDYRRLGVTLTYLRGPSEERILDAARDARADYVYVVARRDRAGQAILARAVEALALWGFKTHVLAEAAAPVPASLSGYPLPGHPLPEAAPWGELELAAALAAGEAAPETLLAAYRLGLIRRAALPASLAEVADD